VPVIESQVVTQVKQNDPERDFVVNTVWHQSDNILLGTDYQNHANEIRDLFYGVDGSGFNLYIPRGGLVKVYDHDDPKPRLPKATATYTPTSWGTPTLAPRDVALCLSYYATNPSIKTQRGRIYIGPWNMSQVGERVPSDVLDMMMALANGLFNIGGANVHHIVYSRKLNEIYDLHHYWCNDTWDTMRSRDIREVTRRTATH
jgi:hypothetical protein